MSKYGTVGGRFYLSEPSAKKEYSIEFPALNGGLNLYDLEYRLQSNESPDMRNLQWKNGALGCRDGQVWVTPELGVGYSFWDRPFHEHLFLHAGDKLYCAPVVGDTDGEVSQLSPAVLLSGVPEERGTFFRFGDYLFYKAAGCYIRIVYHEDGTFSAGDTPVYDPIIQINTEPSTGAGDIYQPENRLSRNKTVWYSTVEGVKEYHLPVQDIEAVLRVEVDGAVLGEDGYSVDLTKGTVTFAEEPTHHDPVRVNTVKITYSKPNEDAYNSIMSCRYAEVYGGDQNVCVVLGGCEAQPNAYFWCGNHTTMDAGYFPMEQYNLAGDTEEQITGFGKQQGMLVVFKDRSIGRATFSTAEMASGRVLIQMPYVNINGETGCDLPWTIRLVENNLVFCNSKQGVHLVQDSSSAHENNVVQVSQKVNGEYARPGLLQAVRAAESDRVCAFDDGMRYWLVADGPAYVWDYSLSSYRDPSWFPHTNIHAVAFASTEHRVYHIGSSGRVTSMAECFSDYGEGIDKAYQFAVQNMGTYDRLKDVRSILLVTRSGTNTVTEIEYHTDYEQRKDPTPIRVFSWRFLPRNLTFRYLGVQNYSHVARRTPNCRGVRHFSMRLTNSEPGQDLSIISAQLFYNFQGRYR